MFFFRVFFRLTSRAQRQLGALWANPLCHNSAMLQTACPFRPSFPNTFVNTQTESSSHRPPEEHVTLGGPLTQRGPMVLVDEPVWSCPLDLVRQGEAAGSA